MPKVTVQFPEQQPKLPPNYRGVHRLNRDEQGRVKCVACYMCSTACPAHCIDIVAAPSPWPDREKYPETFVIDELRCIYCGMCEEACPVDAIELTTLYDLTGLSREEMMFDKEKLLSVFDETVKAGTDPIRTKRGPLERRFGAAGRRTATDSRASVGLSGGSSEPARRPGRRPAAVRDATAATPGTRMRVVTHARSGRRSAGRSLVTASGGLGVAGGLPAAAPAAALLRPGGERPRGAGCWSPAASS